LISARTDVITVRIALASVAVAVAVAVGAIVHPRASGRPTDPRALDRAHARSASLHARIDHIVRPRRRARDVVGRRRASSSPDQSPGFPFLVEVEGGI
tara:strand:+ start:21286 stop:21579 length:294 start_codon:yes stop_codon:yes gene_type:complete